MDKNVEWLHCHKFEAMGYFELLDMRYVDMNVVTQSVFKADCEIVQF